MYKDGLSHTSWNVNDVSFSSSILCCKIRIEPDWNVNREMCKFIKAYKIIRIEPDWNVNATNKPQATKSTK